MLEVRFDGRTAEICGGYLNIGVEDDHNVESIHFTLPEISASQMASLCMVMRDVAGDDIAIPADGVVMVTNKITRHPGTYRCWVEIASMDVDGLVWHSLPFDAYVAALPDIEEIIDEDDPEYSLRLKRLEGQLEALEGDKLDAAFDAALAGRLLYVGADGRIVTLQIGDGLEIIDGKLHVTGGGGGVIVQVDENGDAIIGGAAFIVDENGDAIIGGATFTVDENGDATIG